MNDSDLLIIPASKQELIDVISRVRAVGICRVLRRRRRC